MERVRKSERKRETEGRGEGGVAKRGREGGACRG